MPSRFIGTSSSSSLITMIPRFLLGTNQKKNSKDFILVQLISLIIEIDTAEYFKRMSKIYAAISKTIDSANFTLNATQSEWHFHIKH